MQRRNLVLSLPPMVLAPGLAWAQSSPKTVRIGILVGGLMAPHEEEACAPPMDA